MTEVAPPVASVVRRTSMSRPKGLIDNACLGVTTAGCSGVRGSMYAVSSASRPSSSTRLASPDARCRQTTTVFLGRPYIKPNECSVPASTNRHMKLSTLCRAKARVVPRARAHARPAVALSTKSVSVRYCTISSRSMLFPHPLCSDQTRASCGRCGAGSRAPLAASCCFWPALAAASLWHPRCQERASAWVGQPLTGASIAR